MLIQDALTTASEIQIGLKALNSALSEVESGMPTGNLRRQVADHCATLGRLDKRMEGLVQTIALAKHDADVKAGG